MNGLIILGIDPGLATVGYGIINTDGSAHRYIAHGVLTTAAKTRVSLRLKDIYRQTEELLSQYKPDAIAVEELFFNTNATTAINVSQARGVLLLAISLHSDRVYEYTPLQVKQAIVGYGRAEKNQVQQMVRALLRLDTVPKPDDAADALAVALCHANTFRLSEDFLV